MGTYSIHALPRSGSLRRGFEVEFANETRIVRVLVDAQGRIDGFSRGFAQPAPWVVDLVEAKRPDAFYIVAPYSGLEGRPCEARFEQAMNDWPKPALVAAVGAGTLPQRAKASGCDLNAQILYADAMLYVGPGRELVTAPRDSDFILDAVFRKEMSRRNQIMTGRPLGPVSIAPATAQGFGRAPQSPPAPGEAQRMAAFKSNDKNGDGRLDKEEYRATLDQLGFGAQFDNYLAQRDVNKDGFVSGEEYRPTIQ